MSFHSFTVARPLFALPSEIVDDFQQTHAQQVQETGGRRALLFKFVYRQSFGRRGAPVDSIAKNLPALHSEGRQSKSLGLLSGEAIDEPALPLLDAHTRTSPGKYSSRRSARIEQARRRFPHSHLDVVLYE